MPDVDEWLDSFDPKTYRELLASESLDPDPDVRSAEILKLGFAAICSMLATAISGEEVEITPDKFDPTRSQSRSKNADRTVVTQCGPNQMARLMGGMVSLI